MTFGSRSGQRANSGAMIRISGDPSWDRNLENTWDGAAVDTLVRLTKENVDTAHTS